MTDNTVIIRRTGLVVALSEDSEVGVTIEDFIDAVRDALHGLGYGFSTVNGMFP